MPHAIRFDKTGGPDVLQWVEVEPAQPSAGEVRVKHTAISVNFIDINHRKGQYPLKLPSGLGLAGVGTVDALGDGVTDFKKGDRIGYTSGPIGAYADFNIVKASQAVKILDDIDDKTAAALMMRGLTAWYLLHKTYEVKKGDVIVVHAAAGGVGQILCRWGKKIGATVIALVGSDDKMKTAKEAGADHVLISREPFADKIKELTGGKGAQIVYDSVGKETFEQSLKSLRPRGMLALFGTASGMVPPFDLKALAEGGSLYLTRPSLTHYVSTKEDLQEGADALWQAVRDGIALPQITNEFALKDAAKAHETLESRKTTGAMVLLP
jgi:NADPH2:quinone reductase